jgi:hypothetical protein
VQNNCNEFENQIEVQSLTDLFTVVCLEPMTADASHARQKRAA